MVSDANGKIVVPVWSDDGVVKPVIDDNGRVTVSVGETTITIDINLKSSDITLDVEEQSPLTNIQARGYGWKDPSWRKQAMLWGYSGVVRDYAQCVATGAGVCTALCTTPAVGWVHVYQGFKIVHDDTVARNMEVGVYSGATKYGTKAYVAALANAWLGDPIECVVVNGEQFYASTYLSAAPKHIYLYALGYKMQVGAA